MKKLLYVLCMICVLLFASACVETRTLTCDGCGEKVEVEATSNMEEDWIVLCESCHQKIRDENPDYEY